MESGTFHRGVVTVILSTYNGSKFLQQQLETLYKQSYANIKILVRDDGSSDSTRSILNAEQLKGSLRVLDENNNLGPGGSFLELLRNAAASGSEYVAFCDQDDEWHPEKIARALSMFDNRLNNSPAMYCSRVQIVDESLNHVGFTDAPRTIGFGNALVENIAFGCTIVLNRKALDLICKNLPSKVMMHDWWCYLVVACFGEVIYDGNAYIKYRQHETNAVGVDRNTFDRIKRKLLKLTSPTEKHLLLKQAEVFLSIFDRQIPPSQRPAIDMLVATKKSFLCRFRLVFTTKIWRQKWFDNMILRFLILVNRV